MHMPIYDFLKIVASEREQGGRDGEYDTAGRYDVEIKRKPSQIADKFIRQATRLN